MKGKNPHVIIIITGLSCILCTCIFLTFLSPVDNRHFNYTDYYKDWILKRESIDNWYKRITPTKGKMQAGFSKISLASDISAPLAGYANRNGKMVSFANSINLELAAISLSDGINTAIVLTADLLLIHPSIAQQVQDSLSVYYPEVIPYFTSSHTHSSMGGWAPGPVGKIFAGDFSKAIVDTLVNKLWKCTKSSLEKFHSVKIKQAWLEEKNFIINRIDEKNGKVNGRLSLLHLSFPSENLLLISYPAHATTLSSQNMKPHGDYPQYLKQEIKSKVNSVCLFAAGPVGSMGPQITGSDTSAAFQLAQGLAQPIVLLDNFIKSSSQSDQIQFAAFSFEVPLPNPQWRISQHIAISPWLFDKWFGKPFAQIQVIVLGEFLYMSMPGDFSGELALDLEKTAAEMNKQLIITSFSGSYTGYVLPFHYYYRNTYESRMMSWFGPQYGEYLKQVILDILEVLD